MSRDIGSLLGGVLKNSVLGAVVALVSYLVLQLLCAFLIHCEIVGEGMIYPMVCVSAALASFLGCSCGVIRGGEKRMLSASMVAAVFLSLTVAIGLLSCESGTIDSEWAGVGGAMAVGGLVAAVLPRPMGRGEKAAKGRVGRNGRGRRASSKQPITKRNR